MHGLTWHSHARQYRKTYRINLMSRSQEQKQETGNKASCYRENQPVTPCRLFPYQATWQDVSHLCPLLIHEQIDVSYLSSLRFPIT